METSSKTEMVETAQVEKPIKKEVPKIVAAPPKLNEFEFDGVVTEIGLNGIVVRFKSELQLWELHKKLRQLHPVHVKLTLEK